MKNLKKIDVSKTKFIYKKTKNLKRSKMGSIFLVWACDEKSCWLDRVLAIKIPENIINKQQGKCSKCKKMEGSAKN